MNENGGQKPPEEPEAKSEAEAPDMPKAEPTAEATAEAKKKAAEATKAKAAAAAAAKAKKEAEEAAKPVWERDPAPPSSEDAAGDELVVALAAAHEGAVEKAVQCGDELTIEVARERIAEVCATLKHDQGFKLMVDICGVDYPDREDARFEVVYHVHNIDTNHRVRLKVRAALDQEVPSVTSIWRGADWCEREAYDMYGIRFSGHPDMTRILLWEGFNGYPLRKDFPVEGIDTGAAIYPEYYEEAAGPVIGIGTGWKPPEPPSPEPEAPASTEAPPDSAEPGT